MALTDAILAELRQYAPTIATDAPSLERFSQDYYWYSPWLREQLADKRAEAVITVTTEAEISAVLRLAYREQIPVTARGLGTGNYGQAVPLEGGIVLDLREMNQILSWPNGGVLAEPGVRLAVLEQQARDRDLELRMFPSTIAMASLGGFIAGGSCGIGSINHGVLRDRGNVRSLRVITATEVPQVVDLRGVDIDQALHAYGTNGIITAIDLPLTRRTDWQPLTAAFESLEQAHRCAWAIGRSEGIHKRMITLLEQPLVSYQKPVLEHLAPHAHALLLFVDPTDLSETITLLEEYQGHVVSKLATNLSEATWNHTTLWVLKADRDYTYLQCGFSPDPEQSWHQMRALKARFGDDWLVHSEWVRFMGVVQCWSLPVLRYRDRDYLEAMFAACAELGVGISNPHTYILEEGGHDAGNPVQLAFKQFADPRGILNPGKMKQFSRLS